jgi:hypothetical protein
MPLFSITGLKRDKRPPNKMLLSKSNRHILHKKQGLKLIDIWKTWDRSHHASRIRKLARLTKRRWSRIWYGRKMVMNQGLVGFNILAAWTALSLPLDIMALFSSCFPLCPRLDDLFASSDSIMSTSSSNLRFLLHVYWISVQYYRIQEHGILNFLHIWRLKSSRKEYIEWDSRKSCQPFWNQISLIVGFLRSHLPKMTIMLEKVKENRKTKYF